MKAFVIQLASFPLPFPTPSPPLKICLKHCFLGVKNCFFLQFPSKISHQIFPTKNYFPPVYSYHEYLSSAQFISYCHVFLGRSQVTSMPCLLWPFLWGLALKYGGGKLMEVWSLMEMFAPLCDKAICPRFVTKSHCNNFKRRAPLQIQASCGLLDSLDTHVAEQMLVGYLA